MEHAAGELAEADTLAVDQMLACRPSWSGVVWLRDVVGDDRLLLHPGPPFADPGALPAPVRNSLALASVYEGWAADAVAGQAMVEAGEIALGAAQDYGVVVPLAGAASPSMAAHVVVDQLDESSVRYAVLTEGANHALRKGVLDSQVVSHHAWLDGRLAEWLSDALHEPIELLPLIRSALDRGDDCHSHTSNGSRLLSERLAAMSSPVPDDVADFLRSARSFALNVWMAAAALMLGSAGGMSDSTVVTRAGGNGEQFGIQLSGEPDRWLTVPASAPVGSHDENACPLGAVGDSPVLDFFGLGGMALEHAPDVAREMAAYLPDDILERPGRLLARRDERVGSAVGLTAAACEAAGAGPVVMLTMIDADGAAGQLGAGVFQPPTRLFEQAIRKADRPGRDDRERSESW
jgi:hypothetical protein